MHKVAAVAVKASSVCLSDSRFNARMVVRLPCPIRVRVSFAFACRRSIGATGAVDDGPEELPIHG
jgi:hypothetical protein